MRINENTVLTGNNIILVPYRKEHVPIYHVWMKDPVLQEQTASEPLSIEEEYEMQQTWHVDEDKCTFIVLRKGTADSPDTGVHGGGMIGDVNLFLSTEEIEVDDAALTSTTTTSAAPPAMGPRVAEVEVMIAEAAARGHGCGREAVQMIMNYGLTHLGVEKFVVKIGMSNTASQGMFEKLGFQLVKEVAVFQERHYALPVTDELRSRSAAAVAHVTSGVYDA